MKIGILGGTFHPPHNGHLAIAAEARTEVPLDRVVFVPAGQPYFKEAAAVLPSRHRMEMARLAVRGKPGLECSALEVERPGPTYTVDTLRQLSREMKGDELFFILSWSSLEELPGWREPSGIIELCRLVVVPRPGYQLPDLEALESRIPELSKRLVVMDKPRLYISASDIRRRAAQGLPIRHLVPEAVEEYIRIHRLYQV